MLWLSNEAIEYAVDKCRRESRYKVGIALNSRTKYNEVEMYLRDCLRDTDEFRVCKSVCDTTIKFHNGSYIRVIPASDNARGYKMHLLIADKNISDDVLNCVLRPCEILEWTERQKRQNGVTTNKLLDEISDENIYHDQIRLCAGDRLKCPALYSKETAQGTTKYRQMWFYSIKN